MSGKQQPAPIYGGTAQPQDRSLQPAHSPTGGYQQQGGYQQSQQQYQQPQQQPQYQQPQQQYQQQPQQYGQATLQQDVPVDAKVVEGVPLYPDCTDPAVNQRFVKRGYNDVWAAAIFIAHLVVTFIMAIVTAKQSHDESMHVATKSTHAEREQVDALKMWLPIACVCSVAAASACLAAMRAFPRQYIIAANVVAIVLNVIVAVYCIANGIWMAGIIWLAMAGINAAWLYFVRNRIPFAGCLLTHSINTVTRHFGSIVTSFGALIAVAVYLGMWVLMVIPTVKYFAESANEKESSNSTTQYCVVLVLLLVFFWTTQVIANVVHVTASGTVATWYFVGASAMPKNPSVASLKRAMTTSFGSICFGSLIVAIIKVIHFMVRSATRNQNSFIACIALCIIGIIERLMEYFNVYAFTHVAIYGSSYIEAAKQTWAMVKECGFAAYFNDCLIWPVLSLTTLFNSLALGIIFGYAAGSFMVGLVVFMVCYVIHVMLFRTVYSGVVTIFVCVAECPEMMPIANPQFAAEFEAASALANTSTC
jgi:hypothetical protein